MGENSHRLLLEALVSQMQGPERTFYASSALWNYRLWHVSGGLVFLSSVAATLLAALNRQGPNEAIQLLLIAVPAIGTLAAGLMSLYKFREKEALREEGRIELDRIIAGANSILIDAKCKDDFRKGYQLVLRGASQLLTQKALLRIKTSHLLVRLSLLEIPR